MKILMPGLYKQACACLTATCLLVASFPLSAFADDHLPSHKSGDLREPAMVQPMLSRLASRSSSVAAPLNQAQGDVANAGMDDGTASAQVAPEGQKKANKLMKAKFLASQGSRQITFIENKGQFDERVTFQVASAGRTLWLTQRGIVFDFQQCGRNSITTRAIASKPIPVSLETAQIPKLEKKKSLECAVERHVINQDFLGSSGQPKIETKEVQPEIRNYLAGSDPEKWQTQVHGFSEVIYHDVWPGIDLRLYGKGPDLEQEFIVKPGADAGQVQLAYNGIDNLKIGNDGSLVIHAAADRMRETTPRIYQEISGRRVSVKGRFKLLSSTSYTFEVPAYDKRQPLVIDPTLLYSTFLGGSAGNNIFTTGTRESAVGIAVDLSGNAYVAGFTQSSDFPTTAGAFQTTSAGGQQTFISKLNPAGSALVYSTYLNALLVSAIAVDANGNAYVTGGTQFVGNSVSQFPTTPNAFSQSCSGAGYLAVLNPTGSGLLYSTCFGSGLAVTSMVVDATGHAFVAGSAGVGSTLPTTSNAFQPTYPGSLGSGFVMEFDTSLSGTNSLVYSTYLGIAGPLEGGHPGTTASAVAADGFGKIYLTGIAADGFPVTPRAFQTVHAPCIPNGIACPSSTNAFIAKIDPTVSGQQALIYATYFGGMGTTVTNAIAVDGAGNAYIAGGTQSTLPTTPGSFQSSPPFGTPGPGSASAVGFITKLNAGGSHLVYSTYLMNPCILGVACFGPDVTINGIALDGFGNAYMTGSAGVNGVPVTPDAFQSTVAKTSGDFSLAFVSKLNPTGTGLVYSSLLTGQGDDKATAIAVDPIGDVYIAGQTSSFNFPSTPAAFQPAMDGSGDAFVTKFPLSGNQTLSISSLTPTIGGNSGTVSPQIFGTGFHAGATAQLNCGSVVNGTNVTVGQGGRFLNSTFNLNGVQPSTCDVVIANPDGTSALLPQAFTVQQGGGPNLTIYLTGAVARKVPPEIAIGPASAVILATVTNSGSVDSSGIVLREPLDDSFVLTSNQPIGLGISTQGSADDFDVWVSGAIASGASRTFTATAATSALNACSAPIGAHACVYPDINCHEDTQKLLSCLGPGTAGVGLGCYNKIAACFGGGLSGISLLECVYTIASCSIAERKVVDQCVANAEVCDKGPAICFSDQLPCVQPTDPNNLTGPSGVGTQQWIPRSQRLAYLTSFENEPTATAPAQQVIVKQPLGPNVNLTTLQLLGITIPNGASDIQVPVSPNSLNPSAGANEFTTSVDLRPGQNLLVSADASLDSSTQILTWTFTSIDPATGQPPVNPLVGFLPPGAEANVAFSITPATGLRTGTQIAEQATIVFQGAEPMSTQTWTNAIDNTAPVSQVVTLLPTEPASGFTVNWSGTDVGSGVQDFTIFVSENGGPFTPFQTNTTATSATFTGEVGHTYGFYSVARDLVGNVEANKTTAEATTQVVLATDSIPPTTSAVAAPSPNAAGWNNSNVTVTLNTMDDPGGTGVKQIGYSATGAQPIASTATPGATTSFQISAEGITTIAFFGTDNASNVETPKALTVELDKTPPSIIGSRTPLPNASGWSNTDVIVSFACADALSGLVQNSPPPNTVVTAEGANQSVPGACQDLAGNIASATVSGINIDRTAPTISGMPAAGCTLSATGKLLQIAVVSGADALSGMASFNVSVSSSQAGDDPSEPDIVVAGSGLQPRMVQVRAKTLKGATSRTYTVNAIAVDAAGNAVNSSSTCTVTSNH